MAKLGNVDRNGCLLVKSHQLLEILEIHHKMLGSLQQLTKVLKLNEGNVYTNQLFDQQL